MGDEDDRMMCDDDATTRARATIGASICVRDQDMRMRSQVCDCRRDNSAICAVSGLRWDCRGMGGMVRGLCAMRVCVID